MSTDNKLRLFSGKKAFIYKRITQYEMTNKSTRLIYTDETNLNIYRSLPEKDFKEFMMAYLTYKKGDDIESMFTSLTAKLLFMTYISKIEYNEDKWEKQAKINQENGKKGGRPKKNNADITPNTEFESEASNIIPSVPIKEEKKKDEQPIIQENKEEEFQKDVEVAVNELAQIALYGKGKKVFDEVLTTHSNSLSIRYNKLYDDVEEQLRNMSKEKYLKFKDLKEVG